MSEAVAWDCRLGSLGGAFSSPKDETVAATLDRWRAVAWKVVRVGHRESGSPITVITKRPNGGTARRSVRCLMSESLAVARGRLAGVGVCRPYRIHLRAAGDAAPPVGVDKTRRASGLETWLAVFGRATATG